MVLAKHVHDSVFFTVTPQGISSVAYLAIPLGEVTNFSVAQVSNWIKFPCSREQQQQNWAPCTGH